MRSIRYMALTAENLAVDLLKEGIGFRLASLNLIIESLLGQTVKSKIIITTSTPNESIKQLARQYGIECFTNPNRVGIAEDWEFGYEKACELADYITIAHQDDLYLPNYTERILRNFVKNKDAMICFTNYRVYVYEDNRN